MSNINANTPLLKKIVEAQVTQEKDISRILAILENDITTDTKGLVKQVRDNSEAIKKIHTFNTDLKTRLGIANVILTIATSGFVTFLLNLFFNKP